MKPMDFRGKWVLVTGASSGLGRAMAGVLAREHGANIIPVARRRERLEELKRELETEAGVRVDPLVGDKEAQRGSAAHESGRHGVAVPAPSLLRLSAARSGGSRAITPVTAAS